MTVRIRVLSPVAAALAAALVLGGGSPPSGAADQRLLDGYAVDGDTIRVRGGADIRVIGIDTPERGQCGYDRATRFTARFIADGFRLRKSATTDNRDHYDRKLRYVRNAAGRDLGARLIRRGLGVARYDSTDGYEWHRKQRRYHRLDARQANVCGFDPVGSGSGGNRDSGGRSPSGGAFANCTEARAAGAAPVLRGEPGYGPHLDGDGDGIGCE